MKLGFGLYRHLLSAEHLRFVRQRGATNRIRPRAANDLRRSVARGHRPHLRLAEGRAGFVINSRKKRFNSQLFKPELPMSLIARIKYGLLVLVGILFLFSSLNKSFAQEQTIWFQQPARNWNEALPLGNSRLGAMVNGGADHELIQLNADTFWAGVPHDYSRPDAAQQLPEIRRLIFANKQNEAAALIDKNFMGQPKFQADFEPLGNLRLNFDLPAQAEDYLRELDLRRGLATVRFRSGNTVFTREYFISRPDSVFVMRITASEPGKIRCQSGDSEIKNWRELQNHEAIADHVPAFCCLGNQRERNKFVAVS